MPWNRDNPDDPLEIKRRKLAEQERMLNEQMSRLAQELQDSGEPAPAPVKSPSEPPIWRLEEDPTHRRAPDPTPARRQRNLARQRQRDMILFFVFLALVIIVFAFVLWIAFAPRTE